MNSSRREEYVEVRKARLGLARISVVRGEGPTLGAACIDDYVRSLEPVTDYLTKWSGLVRTYAGCEPKRQLSGMSSP